MSKWEKEKEFDKYFCNRCESIRSVCFHEETNKLKNLIRSEIKKERAKYTVLVEKLKARLKYCEEQNGLLYCKNCGLGPEDWGEEDNN